MKAAAELDKALRHLQEAEEMVQKQAAANACVHSAYYAMHHCASAVILCCGGSGKHADVPKSHEHVIQHFGRIAEREPEAFHELGRLLSRARTDRMVADYDLEQNSTLAEAAATTADARRFIEVCRRRWALTGRGP